MNTNPEKLVVLPRWGSLLNRWASNKGYDCFDTFNVKIHPIALVGLKICITFAISRFLTLNILLEYWKYT